MNKKRNRINTLKGLLFLSPNIIGFSIFTLFPLGFSLIMAFSNWNLSQHNMFTDEPLKWVLLQNFKDLLGSEDFWRYLGNTLFFMIGIPISMAGSLGAALLLNQDLKSPSKRARSKGILYVLPLIAFSSLLFLGFGMSIMVLIVTGIFGVIYIGGVSGGSTVYRTIFYTPNFTAGVATFILWKKIYNPQTGPLTTITQPILEGVNAVVLFLGKDTIYIFMYVVVVLAIGSLYWGLNTFLKWRSEKDLGYIGLIIGVSALILPSFFVLHWFSHPIASQIMQISVIATIVYFVSQFIAKSSDCICHPEKGMGNAIMLGLGIMALQFLLIGLSNVLYKLPEMSLVGISSPSWLTDYHWAKPSLMFMGFWAAIGSNSMLLYLAALSNVSPELSEAADIDGATKFQKFWNVTWPQLAPVTFFIFIMAVINGMQGGFEVAKTMTGGGPAGSTTTLEYFIYEEGFASGRLAFASAISWILFAMIFALTLFNWRFGNRYVND
tara:strand:- start:356 stop:1837 length:1482 start_codon:yes stop_codon:yes gene_type:complete